MCVSALPYSSSQQTPSHTVSTTITAGYRVSDCCTLLPYPRRCSNVACLLVSTNEAGKVTSLSVVARCHAERVTLCARNLSVRAGYSCHDLCLEAEGNVPNDCSASERNCARAIRKEGARVSSPGAFAGVAKHNPWCGVTLRLQSSHLFAATVLRDVLIPRNSTLPALLS